MIVEILNKRDRKYVYRKAKPEYSKADEDQTVVSVVVV